MIGLAPYRAPENLFLLNPLNAPFLTGESPKSGKMPFVGGCFLYGCMALFVLIPIIIAMAAIAEFQIRRELDQRGVITAATVTNHRISVSTSSKGQRTTTYYITYEFYAGTSNNDNPTLYRYEQSVSSATYNNVADGAKLDIRYLSDDPNTSRMLDDGANNPLVILIFSVLFLTVPLAIIYQFRRASSRYKRLITEGQLITGQITEAKLQQVKSSYRLMLRYTFMSPEGIELGKQETFGRSDLVNGTTPEPGTPVAVLFLNPKLYRVL